MATHHPEFQLRHEATDELKRLATHPLGEVERLEAEAREGKTAASLGILVTAVVVGVWSVAAIVYGLVVLVAWLVTG
jgi:hypothetical protein